MPVFSEVEEEHREHQHQHHQQERAEHRVSEAALEQIPEPDHEGRELIRFPCKKKQLVMRYPRSAAEAKRSRLEKEYPPRGDDPRRRSGITGQAGAQPE